jgi:hypothetical protein
MIPKNILIFFSLLLFPLASFSQNDSISAKSNFQGSNGKRVILKTDIINGLRSPLISLSAEYIINKNFSLTLGGRYSKGKYNQIYEPAEYTDYNPQIENKLKDKATIDAREVFIEGRFYTSKKKTTPIGSFIFTKLRYGRANVIGNYYKSLNENVGRAYYMPSISDNPYYTYTAKNINFCTIEAGYGLQTVINKRFILGLSLGVGKTFFNINKKYEDKELSGVAKTFGPNFIRIYPQSSNKKSDTPDPTIVEKEKSKEYNTGNWGTVLYVQIGILLF